MVQEKRFVVLFLGIFLLLVTIFSMYFVFASHIVTLSDGQSWFKPTEDVPYNFSIFINNTETNLVTGNITQVNITFSSTFTFINNTGTNALQVASFTNTSSMLMWINNTGLIPNWTTVFFWFNASASTPGNYTINVSTKNSTSIMNTSLTVVVNDTTNTTAYFGKDPADNSSVITSSTVTFNLSCGDNSLSLNQLQLWGNWTGTWHLNQTNSTPTNGSAWYPTVSGLPNGHYIWSVYCNDSYGNWNRTTSNKTFYIRAFPFNGTVRDVNGNPLNYTNVSILVKNSSWAQLDYATIPSHFSGFFNLNVFGNSSLNYVYQLSLTHTNETTGAVDWVGQSLPAFPYAEFSTLSNVNFYLRPAGTINITVINSSGVQVPNNQFAYQVKDKKLGYPVEGCSTVGSTSVMCYVPNDRNYSIMIYPSSGSPQHFVPVSFEWNNFSATSSGYCNSTVYSTAFYNATLKTLTKQFNVTESFSRINGSILRSGISSWNEFIVVAYLFEPGQMIFMDGGALPYNASSFGSNKEIYDLAIGYYNLSLPYSPSETVNYLLFAAAKNGSVYYGGFRNLTVSNATQSSFNFTMYGLLGDDSNITLVNANNASNQIVRTKMQTFRLVNATDNVTLTISAHLETTVDYSSYNATEFTFMNDLTGSGTSNFSIPLLNVTGFKEMNVYSMNQAPKNVQIRTASQITSNSNISMTAFDPGDIDGTTLTGLEVAMYRSNSSCDVPSPDTTCQIVAPGDVSQSAMFSSVVGGGSLSFRMGLLDSGVIIHYVNVDMLASGPPDGLFDDSQYAGTTTGAFETAFRFGSQGPTIYDYVLVSMPYTEGSSSTTGLNENLPVNLSIPLIYDENWNIIWNVTSNGTDGGNLAGNQSHYSTYSTQWQTLMGNNTCHTNASSINSTHPCYIDTTNNRIWIRLPHFSGTAPTAIGSVITATSSSSSSSSGGGGGTGVGGATHVVSESEFNAGYSRSMLIRDKLKFNVSKESHTLELTGLTTTSATIKVTSTTQTATLSVGEIKKFELTGDNYYDLAVTLDKISVVGSNATRANITIKTDSSEVVSTIPTTTTPEEETPSITGEAVNNEKNSQKGGISFWMIIIPLVIIIAIITFFALRKHDKKRKYGY